MSPAVSPLPGPPAHPPTLERLVPTAPVTPRVCPWHPGEPKVSAAGRQPTMLGVWLGCQHEDWHGGTAGRNCCQSQGQSLGSPGTPCPPACLRQAYRVLPNLGASCLGVHHPAISPGFCSSSKPSRGPCQGSASSSYRSLPSPRRPGEPGQGKPWSGQGTAPTVKGQVWAPGSRCRAGERGHPCYGPILAGTPLQRRAGHCPGQGPARSGTEPGVARKRRRRRARGTYLGGWGSRRTGAHAPPFLPAPGSGAGPGSPSGRAASLLLRLSGGSRVSPRQSHGWLCHADRYQPP